jgi:hypothetical protein
MHAQIRASPDDTATNMRTVVDSLAGGGINIEAIAPDFESPHVRVLVEHLDPFEAENANDPFNRALAALRTAGLEPEEHAATTAMLPNDPGALQTAIQAIEADGKTVEAILVLPGSPAPGKANVSFGVGPSPIPGWDEAAARRLADLIEAAFGSAP